MKDAGSIGGKSKGVEDFPPPFIDAGKVSVSAAATALLLALAGCATTPTSDDYCTLPVKRDAGVGVIVQGCAAWTIGTPREGRR